MAVAKIADRWIAPDHRYFRLLGDDGATYILRHDIETELWEVTFYDRSETR